MSNKRSEPSFALSVPFIMLDDFLGLLNVLKEFSQVFNLFGPWINSVKGFPDAIFRYISQNFLRCRIDVCKQPFIISGIDNIR